MIMMFQWFITNKITSWTLKQSVFKENCTIDRNRISRYYHTVYQRHFTQPTIFPTFKSRECSMHLKCAKNVQLQRKIQNDTLGMKAFDIFWAFFEAFFAPFPFANFSPSPFIY